MARRDRRRIDYAGGDPPITRPSNPHAPPPKAVVDRWYGKLLLLLVAAVLLTLSFAPFKQFWAGWIGIVPLIVVLARSNGPWRGAFWWWLGGVLFFSANLWWLLKITGPGVVAMVLSLGLYWALAAAVLRPILRTAAGRSGLQNGPTAGSASHGATDVQNEPTPGAEPPGPDRTEAWAVHPAPALRFLLLFPVIWVGAEWIRGNWPFQGFSWFNLSYAQTPALFLCQIVDLFGEHVISFWVAMINALVALFVLNGWRWRGLLRPVLVVCGAMLAIGVYGVWRIAQTDSMLTPGPTVLVVQPNVPQSNTGEKGAPLEELVDFHGYETNMALQRHPKTDLAVWSETMMPQLNDEFFADMARQRLAARDSERAKRQIADLARHYGVSLLVGGAYAGKTTVVGTSPAAFNVQFAGRRNSAYYFMRDSGQLVDRFDKIHLVPFGEYIPFEQAFPWLYRQMIALGPPNMEDYQLDPGERPVIFDLPKDRQPDTLPGGGAGADADPSWRFVTTICFEDADADLNAWLLRGGAARGSIGAKKADFIVNISNDGWFDLTMMPQHLQVGTLRSIENRVPTARSVNTGISGFIDSAGRTQDNLLLPSYTEGTLVHRIMLDSRTTFFTRWGNLIGPACAAGLGLLAVVQWVKSRRQMRK